MLCIHIQGHTLSKPPALMDAVTKKWDKRGYEFPVRANAAFIAEMHRAWTDNPNSVDHNGLIGFLVLNAF